MTRILVIDDERSLMTGIVEMLNLEGFEAIGASDGAEGVAVARAVLPHLIVCDISMPILDGYGVLAELRKYPETVNIPLIFLTARVDHESIRQGMNLGADDYLTKPFTNQELIGAVRSRLSRYQQMESASYADVSRVKEALMQMVSHELRTPLVSITSVHEYLSSQLEQLTDAEKRNLLDIMASGTNRLGNLVEQMVLLTQLETKLLSEETIAKHGTPTLLWNVVIAAINEARTFAHRRKEGEIRYNQGDGNAEVRCVSPVLRHALSELIANALDFSEHEQAVLLNTWATDEEIFIEIINFGIPIRPDEVELAFQPFQQINRNYYEQQGMGLGLTLARRIILLHGGDLGMYSDSGRTTVTLSLPRAS